MKIIKKLPGSFSSGVFLVEIEKEKFVLKQTNDPSEVYSEKEFYNLISRLGLPTLNYLKEYPCELNEIVLEYVEGSTTLANKFTENNCKDWGKITRTLHDKKFNECFKINGNNEKEAISWSDYIQHKIADAFKNSSENNNYGFDSEKLKKIKNYLLPLTQFELGEFSLIHADYHSANILIKNGELFIFDKNPDVFSGDRLLDLAIATIDMPNGTLMTTNNKEYANDKTCLHSFISGYGENYLKDNNFKKYVMLVAFGRLYTPFSENYREIINQLLVD